jgi:hypothetical protein
MSIFESRCTYLFGKVSCCIKVRKVSYGKVTSFPVINVGTRYRHTNTFRTIYHIGVTTETGGEEVTLYGFLSRNSLVRISVHLFIS